MEQCKCSMWGNFGDCTKINYTSQIQNTFFHPSIVFFTLDRSNSLCRVGLFFSNRRHPCDFAVSWLYGQHDTDGCSDLKRKTLFPDLVLVTHDNKIFRMNTHHSSKQLSQPYLSYCAVFNKASKIVDVDTWRVFLASCQWLTRGQIPLWETVVLWRLETRIWRCDNTITSGTSETHPHSM